jgi:hypothetical protein
MTATNSTTTNPLILNVINVSGTSTLITAVKNTEYRINYADNNAGKLIQFPILTNAENGSVIRIVDIGGNFEGDVNSTPPVYRDVVAQVLGGSSIATGGNGTGLSTNFGLWEFKYRHVIGTNGHWNNVSIPFDTQSSHRNTQYNRNYEIIGATGILWNLSKQQILTILSGGTANITFSNPTTNIDGAIMTLIIHNNPGGNRTVTFGNKFKFRGNVNHTTISGGADRSDIFTFICTGNGNLKEVYRSLDVVFTNL